jgi:hypothetical protein
VLSTNAVIISNNTARFTSKFVNFNCSVCEMSL